MNRIQTQSSNDSQGTRMLTDAELDVVIGGASPYAGYGPLGNHMPLLDPTWALVSFNGQTLG